VEEEGLTSDELQEALQGMGSNSLAIQPHTLVAELLAGGEGTVAAGVYGHLVDRLADSGAPVTWTEPAIVEPIVIFPLSVAMTEEPASPATAMLFMDWLLTDAQDLLGPEFGRTGVRELGPEGGLANVESLVFDSAEFAGNREEWRSRYEAILEGVAEDIKE